ncbi:DUF1918 domain-containing protein [Actinoplanes missouriensis]|uniref:DUF1918 domain-containing protein n=1 Tax=Actinoplanes missouriensis TaxID=1866 RepID=UPI0033E6910A
MRAHVGDRIIIESLHPRVAPRIGVIVGVSYPSGRPPYRVRWLIHGHVTLIIPGPEARLEPFADPSPDETG